VYPHIVAFSESRTTVPVAVTVDISQNIDPTISYVDTSLCTITLSENGKEVDTLFYEPTSKSYFSNYLPKSGNQYELTVEKPNFLTAVAHTVAQAPVPIDAVAVQPKVRRDKDGNWQDELDITFTDPPTNGDYYLIQFFVGENNLSSYSQSIPCINTTDPSIETLTGKGIDDNSCIGGEGIVLRDLYFNGATKKARMFIPADATMPVMLGTDSVFLQVELLHISENYFKYLKSTKVNIDNKDNPFSEPVNVFSNFSGGYGVFSISSASRYKFK
jgi:hypothetical protein